VTDLPRFHKGGLGPLDFQTINEAFRRLDALRPLIESASINQSGESKVPRMTVVRAEVIPEEELPEDLPESSALLYKWEELFIRGDEKGGDPNTVVQPTDADYIPTVIESTFRTGPVNNLGEEGTVQTGHGVSVDPGFRRGLAILLDYNRTDATRVHLLLPIKPSSRTFLALIEGSGGPVTFDLTECEKNGEGEPGAEAEIKAFVYTARELRAFQVGSSNTPSFCRSGNINLFDFSRNNKNEPAGPDGVTYEVEPLGAGNVVTAHALTFGPGIEFYFTGWLPRLGVTCPPEDPLTPPDPRVGDFVSPTNMRKMQGYGGRE
jgi:hypothetical protein